MEFAPSGVLSFEVTFDAPDLIVGMSVYDDTGASPALVAGPTLMTNFFQNSYRAKFSATTGKSYLIVKAVYNAEDFSSLDSNYLQSSESVFVQDISGGGGGSGGAVVGYVIPNNTLIGLVTC